MTRQIIRKIIVIYGSIMSGCMMLFIFVIFFPSLQFLQIKGDVEPFKRSKPHLFSPSTKPKERAIF